MYSVLIQSDSDLVLVRAALYERYARIKKDIIWCQKMCAKYGTAYYGRELVSLEGERYQISRILGNHRFGPFVHTSPGWYLR